MIVAVQTLTNRLSVTQLTQAVNAVQKQVTQHVKPVWAVDATLVVVPRGNPIPAGAWFCTVQDDIDLAGANGYHSFKTGGLPYAVVKYNSEWTLTLSHEILEMIVNPYTNYYKPVDNKASGQVDVLVEICDAVQQSQFAYKIDGVTVSDFYYPSFFDLVAVKGKQYNYTNTLTEPLQISDGGFISFTRAGQFYRAVSVRGKIEISNINDLAKQNPITTVVLVLIGLIILKKIV